MATRRGPQGAGAAVETAAPAAGAAGGAKFRQTSNNIMYDPRVVRGSTYAMPIVTPVSKNQRGEERSDLRPQRTSPSMIS